MINNKMPPKPTFFLNQQLLDSIPRDTTIIVGFSGGPDSVYLLLLLKNLETSHRLTIIAAHLDHAWRKESADDARWCQKFCEIYKIRFISKTAHELHINIKPNGSREEVGRLLRRHFLQECALNFKASAIALAHHSSDQLETFFIRLARGTSLAGLCCMKSLDGIFIRPLLSMKKTEMLAYLSDHSIPFLSDSSNNDLCFLRNRIRHQLVPILNTIDGRLKNNVISCIDHLQKTDFFLGELAITTMKSLTNPDGIDISSFLNLHEVMQQRILMMLIIQHKVKCSPSQKFFNEIIRFLKATKNNEHTVHHNLKIIKRRQSFSFKAL